MKKNKRSGVAALLSAACATVIAHQAAATDQFFADDGSALSAAKWGASVAGPFSSTFTSGNIANFAIAGTGTGASLVLAGINATANFTLTAIGGTISNQSNGIDTINVSPSVLLDFSTEAFTSSTTAGYNLTGGGIFATAGGTYGGGFTLTNGTLVARGVNAMGNGVLNINGGTIAATGNTNFATKFGQINVGGDFTLGASSSATGGTASASANLGFADPVNLGSSAHQFILGGSGNYTFSGALTGSAGLTVSGNGGGTLILTSTNNSATLTGGFAVTGSEVDISADLTLGAAPTTPTNDILIDGGRLGSNSGLSFTINQNRNILLGDAAGTSFSTKGAGDITYNGVFQDKDVNTHGILVKQGGGILDIGGVNNYSGATSINNGTIRLQTADNRLPIGTTLNLGQTASANTGILDLAGHNQQIAGLSSITGTGVTLKNTVTTGSAAMLTIAGAGTYLYGDGSANNSGIITGSVGISMTGSGSQTLGDTNTFTGNTSVSNGTLFINGSTAPASNVSVSGATLSGHGTINGAVTLHTGATIAPGASATNVVSTLTTGALTFLTGGSYNWQLLNATGTAGNGYDQITATGLDLTDLSDSSHTFNLNLSSISDAAGTAGPATFSNAANQSWVIVHTTAGGITDPANITNVNLNAVGISNDLGGGHFSVQTAGNDLDLVFTANPNAVTLVWNGTSGTNSWNTTGTNTNWLNGPASSSFTTGNNVTFADTGARSVAIDSGGVSPGTITINNLVTQNSGQPLVFSDGSLGGAGPLTKTGTGTVVFQSASNYGGGTNLTGGVIQLGIDNGLPSTTALTSSPSTTLDLNGHNQTIASLTDGGSSGGGNITLGGGTLSVGDGNNTTFTGIISQAGSLVKEGSGNLALGGANSYGGSTTISGGHLVLAAGTGSLPSTTNIIIGAGPGIRLDLNGNTQTVQEISGGNNGTTSLSLGGGTFNVGGDNVSTSFAGGVSGDAGSTFHKQGAGTLTLTGSYNVQGGTVYNGNTAIDVGGAIQFAQAAASIVDLSTDSTGTAFAGNVLVSNAIRLDFNAGTFDGGGKIQIQASGSSVDTTGTSDLTGPIVNNEIDLNSLSLPGPFSTNIGATKGLTLPNTLTINGQITGHSDVNFSSQGSGGQGILILGGQNNYTGATTININTMGVIQLNVPGALPAATSMTFGNGSDNVGALDLNGSDQTIASLASNTTGTINGVVNSGTPVTLTIKGSATTTYAGAIGVSGLNLAFPQNLLNANTNVSLTLDPANTGSLSLTAVNGYTGDTTIHSGTLAVNGSGSINADGGNVNIGGGSTNAAANPTLAGTGTISGPTTVNAAGVGAGTAGHVAPGAPGSTLAPSGTLTFTNGLTFAAASDADFTLGVPAGSTPTTTGFSSLISVTGGGLTLPSGGTGNQVIVNLTDDAGAHGSIGSGTYELFSFNSLSGSFDPNEFVIGTSPLAAGTSYVFNQSLGANTIDLQITAVVSGPQSLTFTGSTTANALNPSGAWNINSTTDFTAGAGAVVYHDGDSVTFNDAGNTGAQYNITLDATGATAHAGSLSPSAVTVSTANTYTFGGAGIAGSTGLTKSGAGTLILNNANTYTGNTNVTQGTLTLGAAGSIAGSANVNIGVVAGTSGTLSLSAPTSGVLTQTMGTLNVNNGAVNLAAVPLGATHVGTHTVLSVNGLTVTPTGKIDLTDNVMVVTGTSGTVATNLTNVVTYLKSGLNSAGHGYWNGTTGIVSSTAATGDSRYLSTIGYRQGTGSASFEGTTPGANDVIVAYTYYGDADLNGQVDGGDYTQIDNGFSMHRTGWSNGDFNYDGVVDGTDFALIDNAYNQLTAMGKIATPLALAAPSDLVASPSALIASPADISAVPEPTTLGLLGIGAMSLLGRRRRRNV